MLGMSTKNNRVTHCEICPLCYNVVAVINGIIERTNTEEAEQYSDCERKKNGYCEFFRARASIDKIRFNMHDRTPQK